jgi:hypothetical protein
MLKKDVEKKKERKERPLSERRSEKLGFGIIK